MEPQQPVIRTYRGRDRRSAEEVYRLDAASAGRAAWYPVAHRWVSSWGGEELSVVFEYRGVDLLLQPPTAAPQQRSEQLSVSEAPDPERPRTEPAPTAGGPFDWPIPPSVESRAQPAPGTVPVREPPSEQAETGSSTEEPTLADGAAALPGGPAAPTPESGAGGAQANARQSSMPTVRAHARAVVQAIDLHAAGEPLRLIRSGFPPVPIAPILERRRWLKHNADYARRMLMFEPRGHRDMYGAILLPPYRDDADIAVLFMHNEGYSTMCGHGIIAIATGLVEEGLYPASAPETLIRFETPAGVVTASAAVTWTADERNEVSSVRFHNVASYLHESGLRVSPPGVALHGRALEDGGLSVDLAFGGAYYGVVDAADLGLRVVPEQADLLARAGAAITDLLRRDHTPAHPTDPDLGFVYGTIIVDGDPASSPDGRAREATFRNVAIFADGELDRSPCGSGTSALLARLHAIGQLRTGQEVVSAGIIGEAFSARVEEESSLGEYRAVITSVQGNAYITGYHTFVLDERDPLGNGFLLR